MSAYDSLQVIAVEVDDGVAWASIDHPPLNLWDTTLTADLVKLIADVDFISEQFFEIRRIGPGNLNFDNVSFFLNAMDTLVGDESFVALRNRRVRHRTLARVEAQTQDFIEQRTLEEQNAEVERKNHEVEQARQALEEKASQLALTSKYKSEFLANMSHELRTPLNSLLILAKMLYENQEGNLTAKQVELATLIHRSGQELLALINEVLDITRIETGDFAFSPEPVR